MKRIFINTDGGSRGNPGPAAIGIVFSDKAGGVIHTHKEYIGRATNNEAEYQALITACEILRKSKWLKENNGNEGEVVCRLDSKLVVEQLGGNFKIKQDHLRELVNRVKDFVRSNRAKVSFVHIPREQNKLADKLVNAALDEALKKSK